MTTATPTSSQQAPFGEPNPYATTAAPAAETRGFSIASLVLGLVSIVAALHVLRAGRRPRARHHGAQREPASRTMAIWGIVLNSVMLAGTVLVGLGFAVFGLAMLPFAFL